MVNPINDKSLTQLTGLSTGAASSAQSSASADPGPAVRVEISQASQLGKFPAPAATAELATSELVREIRDRVQSGRFDIDYESIGQAMLHDVLARAVGRRG